jgi:hypothetical protein
VQSNEKQQPERRCFQSQHKDVDANKLKAFLKAEERQKHEAMQIERTERLVTVIKLLKAVVYLGDAQQIMMGLSTLEKMQLEMLSSNKRDYLKQQNCEGR